MAFELPRHVALRIATRCALSAEPVEPLRPVLPVRSMTDPSLDLARPPMSALWNEAVDMIPTPFHDRPSVLTAYSATACALA